MVKQQSPKRKKLAVEVKKNSSTTPEEANVSIETSIIEAKVEGGIKSEVSSHKEKIAPKAARAKGEPEQSEGIKTKKSSINDQENLEATHQVIKQKHQTQIRQVSFIVRLKIDRHDQPPRIEIEYASDSKNEHASGSVKPDKFVGFNGERLITFMKACISPTIITEPVVSVESPHLPPPSFEEAESPTSESRRARASLVITDVQLFHSMVPNSMTLTLVFGEPYFIQAQFQIQGPDVHSLTALKPSCELKVYANEVTSGKSWLLTTSSTELIQNVAEYRIRAKIPRVPPGFYRLFTVVNICAPIKMAGFYENAVHVI
jgi:hypothetical protein